MSKPDGGPAFPASAFAGAVHAGDWAVSSAQAGMTLRDWFAGQALAGNCGFPTTEGHISTTLAEEAYRIADAMLAERER